MKFKWKTFIVGYLSIFVLFHLFGILEMGYNLYIDCYDIQTFIGILLASLAGVLIALWMFLFEI